MQLIMIMRHNCTITWSIMQFQFVGCQLQACTSIPYMFKYKSTKHMHTYRLQPQPDSIRRFRNQGMLCNHPEVSKGEQTSVPILCLCTCVSKMQQLYLVDIYIPVVQVAWCDHHCALFINGKTFFGTSRSDVETKYSLHKGAAF